jgi:hypothetical protein
VDAELRFLIRRRDPFESGKPVWGVNVMISKPVSQKKSAYFCLKILLTFGEKKIGIFLFKNTANFWRKKLDHGIAF